MENKQKITVKSPVDGQRRTIVWFPGSSEESIELSIKNAVGVPPDSEILLRDPADGCIVAISESLPSGIDLEAVLRGSVSADVRTDKAAVAEEREKEKEAAAETAPLVSKSSAADSESKFRGQLLKFERINAHLANERTWLAWIRTALSLLSCSFTLLGESNDMTSYTLNTMYFVVGCIAIAATDLTWLTGWARYGKIKEVLSLPKDQLPEHFHRFKLSHQARLLGFLLTVIMFMYWLSY